MEQKKIKPYIGHHLNTKWGIKGCPAYAEKIGANFFQIFLTSPKQFNAKRKSEADLCYVKDRVIKGGLKLVIHANYMLNFCNPPDTYIHNQAIKLLKADLDESVKCGAIGVVIHMGKCLKMDQEYAINNYVAGVRKCLKESDKGSTIILETGAGQGTEVCTSLFALSELYNRFTKKERKRIKICIDTCHVYAAGYDLKDPKYVTVFCDLIDCLFGWETVACIHLNDSKCSLNSKKDRHADIGKGLIGEDGLKVFTKYCVKKGIPIVLETPCEDSFSRDQQIKLVRSWL